MSQSTATNGQSGSVFRAASFGPEELERFASLFVPVWDQPKDDVAAGPDPGFKAAPLGAMLAADLIPRSSRSTPPPPVVVVDDEKDKLAHAKTMKAIVPAPNAAKAKASAPAAAATPAAFAKPRIETVASDLDALPAGGKSKTPMILGGLALVAAVAIGIFATRGGKEAGADAKTTGGEVKTESTAKKEEAARLPDPAKVADTAAATATTAAPPPATAKAPEPEKTAEPVKAEPVKAPEPAKTAEPPPAPKPPPVVAKPPATTPPATKPTYTAKPPATTTPATKPTATKPKMKEDF